MQPLRLQRHRRRLDARRRRLHRLRLRPRGPDHRVGSPVPGQRDGRVVGHRPIRVLRRYSLVIISQCSAQVFIRAGRRFSKRAFSTRRSMIKKALTTVVSTFYQRFDDYFCDGHLFDSSLFIRLTIGYKLTTNCFYFGGNNFFFWFGSLKRAGC